MNLFLCSSNIAKPDLLKALLRPTADLPQVAIINNAQDTYPADLAIERGHALSERFVSIGFRTIPLDLRKYEHKTDVLNSLLQTCQLVWCSGGNVFWLRYVMKISGFDRIIKPLLSAGLVYGGWSAGAVVAGPTLKTIELMDDPEKAPEVNWDGLGLVDCFIWPHWDTEKYVHLQEAASERMKRLPYEALTLKDGEVYIVNGNEKVVICE